MINLILAQNSPAGGGLNLLVLGAIWLGIMYFLMIRPQRLKARKHKESIDTLKVGDTVITQGGIYATIEKVESETFDVKIDTNVNIKIARASIQAFNNSNNQKK